MCVFFNSISKPRIHNFRVQFPPITPVSLYMGLKKKSISPLLLSLCFRLFCSLLNRKYTFQHHLHLSLTSWSQCPPCCLRTVSLLCFLNTFRRSSMTCREVTQCFSENSEGRVLRKALSNIVEMKAVGQALLSSLISTADSSLIHKVPIRFYSILSQSEIL